MATMRTTNDRVPSEVARVVPRGSTARTPTTTAAAMPRTVIIPAPMSTSLPGVL